MNKELEHVWLEAIEDRKPYITDNSEWMLDLGAKIEKFRDGRIEIHNTIVPGDNYARLTREQTVFFIEHGWHSGRLKVCLDTYKERMDRSEYKDLNTDSVKERIKDFEIKLSKSLESN